MDTIAVVGLMLAAVMLACYFAPKGWRTRVVALVQPLVPVGLEIVNYFAGFPWGQVLDQATALVMVAFMSVTQIIMRQVTTTPPGRGE